MAQERLPGLHSGVMTTLTPGDPMSRSMGQYGKGHSFALPSPADMAGLPSDAGGSPKPGGFAAVVSPLKLRGGTATPYGKGSRR